MSLSAGRTEQRLLAGGARVYRAHHAAEEIFGEGRHSMNA